MRTLSVNPMCVLDSARRGHRADRGGGLSGIHGRKPLDISSLAREAGVSRGVVHRRTGLRQQIRSYPTAPPISDDVPPSVLHSERSIVAALRTRLTAREASIT
ncbi:MULTISPECIES: hypothetical protein [unclassified Mycolicibacterium]|uniref:hypothetical protein n=1 Tax=unclassified Mycolicibacterium TaxID=2636767 RepID=UPI002EDA0D32